MQKATLLVCAMLMSACSPLIGVFARAVNSGTTQIHAGERLTGATTHAPDTYTLPCGSSAGGADTVYVFVPTQSGLYRVDVRAEYDSVLGILDESRQSLGCNDDSGAAGHSLVELSFEAGRSYLIVVTGYEGATGSFALSVTRGAPEDAPHAAVSDAAHELVLGQRRDGNTSNGSDAHTPRCGSVSGSPDEAWTFTAPETGSFQVDVDAVFDSTLAVYDQTSHQPLGCNDDYGSERASQLVVPLQAGQRYEIVIDGYNGQSGAYGVVVNRSVPPTEGAHEVETATPGGAVIDDPFTQSDESAPAPP